MNDEGLPTIAQDIIRSIEAFEARAALERLADPHDGGALPAPLRGLLRARALYAVERWHDSYDLLREVRAMKNLDTLVRVEVQFRMARVLRHASPLVDAGLELALAAARSGVRAGGTGKQLAVWAHVEAALLYGRKRCPDLAARELARAEAIGVERGPVVAARADLALQFDERVRAKEGYEEVLRIAAGASGDEKANAERVGRLGLARLHTILGEFDEAANHVGALGPRPPGDLAARRVRWRLLAARGSFREVADVLGEILEAAPDGDNARSIALERATALYRAGDVEAAIGAWNRLAATGGGDFAARTAARTLQKVQKQADAKRVRLVAFPSVTQLRNHCGPASVELCLRFFGTTADQVSVAREIKHPDGGTPVHRMRAYMDAAGFVTRRIEAGLDTLRAVLDAGVPVIIEEDYSTTRHVAVAIGYDDRREVLEVQDPMTHEVRETPYEDLEKLREFSNHGALVAVPRDRADLLAALDAAGAVECEYMTKTDLAWAAHDQERDEEAARLVDEAVALHEPYELAWVLKFVRARNAFLDDRTEAKKEPLIAVLRKILALWPNDEWPQQFLGRVYDLEDRPADALEAFERARDRDPADANNWCSIGDAHVALGNREAAQKAFDEALQRDPGHVRANENLANVAWELADISLAALLNECARELGPDNPFNHHVHARILARRNDLAGAVAAYDEAMRLAPERVGFRVERAKLLARAGKVDEALASLDTGEETSQVLVTRADLAYEHGRLDVCLAACEQIRALEPDSAVPDAIGGAALCKRGELEAGLTKLRQALAKVPAYEWVYREMGAALAAAGRHVEAVTASAAAVGFYPKGGGLVLALAKALEAAGQTDEAVTQARRAVDLGGLGEDGFLAAADIVRRGQGAGAAHRMLGRIGEIVPRDPAIPRAHVSLLVDRIWAPETARAVITRLSELVPEDPYVLANEADDLMDASLSDEARGEEMFRRLLDNPSGGRYARRLYARQLLARGRFEEALATCEPLEPDTHTIEDRVHALLGLGKGDAARAAVDAFAAAQPEEDRAAARRPHDFAIAKAERRWEDALALAEALCEDEGELPDDGELGEREIELFRCLAEIGRDEDAYVFGRKQCADASDLGRLAYEALTANSLKLARLLAERAADENEDEIHARAVNARFSELDGMEAFAEVYWERVKELSSWHASHENLGRLALGRGELDVAAEELELAVETGHVCPVALHHRAELEVLRDDLASARRFAERALACQKLELRGCDDDLVALVCALRGEREEARRRFDAAATRGVWSANDRARVAKVREALGV